MKKDGGPRQLYDGIHALLPGSLGAPFNDQNAADVTSYINSAFGGIRFAEITGGNACIQDLVRSFGDDAMKIVYVEYDLPRAEPYALERLSG